MIDGEEVSCSLSSRQLHMNMTKNPNVTFKSKVASLLAYVKKAY